MTIRPATAAAPKSPTTRSLREAIDSAGPRCRVVPGAATDAALGQLLLATLTPLTLEVAGPFRPRSRPAPPKPTPCAPATSNAPAPREPGPPPLPRRRARQPAGVATTLEADWNAALRGLRAAQDDYDHATAAAAALTGDDKARIRALAADFPALWTEPATRSASASGWPGCSSTTSP